MQVNIIGAQKIIWQGRAKEMILPAEDGEVCILDFHQPFLMRLRRGYIRLPDRRTSIKDGIAFMRGNELTVFVET